MSSKAGRWHDGTPWSRRFSRAAAGHAECWNGSNRNPGRAYALRQEHLTQQECGVRVLPHAICRLERTDSVGQPDNDCVSWNSSFPGVQANSAATSVRALLPGTSVQPAQGLFFGGNFWDSRATGYKLRVPDAEQAQGPPVDTLEMGFPDTACIAFRLSAAAYRPLFEEVWGQGSFAIKFPA